MKKNTYLLFSVFSLIFIFPIILGLCIPSPSVITPDSTASEQNQEFSISCLDTKLNTISQVNLEEHLIGVLAAEMPASFESEALKAQAVAARSYILSKLRTVSEDHPDAVICTNPTHCKGWLSEEAAKSNWAQKERQVYWEKLRNAVNATKGEYMMYDNEAVEACFFASGGSRTENSEDVWVSSLPYLRSVENPESDDSTKSTASFDNSDFIKKISPHLDEAPTSAVPRISEITRTSGGSVATVKIFDKTFKGTQIRSIFGLKSANFTITQENNRVIFEVIGHGHGVGMSQKGANQMAKYGKKYTEILSHYYTNIQIVKM